MKRVAAVLVCVLGCSTSASFSSQSGSGSASPGSGQGKPALQGGDATNPGTAPAGDGGGGAGPAGSGSVAAAPCKPALADTATSLFSGRIVIKLPKGVELVEQNPFLAVAAAAQSTTSCGGIVKYAAAGYFEFPAGADVTGVRNHLMDLRGIPDETITWAEEGVRGRHYTAAYTAAADAKTGAPETRGWLVLRDAPNDKYAYFAMFEADPAAFDGLRPVFQESGKNLLVKPKALQAPDVVEAKPNTTKPITTKPAK